MNIHHVVKGNLNKTTKIEASLVGLIKLFKGVAVGKGIRHLELYAYCKAIKGIRRINQINCTNKKYTPQPLKKNRVMRRAYKNRYIALCNGNLIKSNSRNDLELKVYELLEKNQEVDTSLFKSVKRSSSGYPLKGFGEYTFRTKDREALGELKGYRYLSCSSVDSDNVQLYDKDRQVWN